MATSFALITGATSGIGLALAHCHARAKGDLFLVARRGDALETLKQELIARYGVTVHTMVQDLSETDAALAIWEKTQTENLHIDLLINNAGFGDYGFFHETNPARIQQMIQLNITSLTQLCRLYLPNMIAKRTGGILNIASTAAFQPGPGMSVYFATKSFVLNFSEGLYEEVKAYGVRISALCPGPTSTQFFASANMEGSRLTRLMPMPTAEEVAAMGYTSVLKGKAVSVYGGMNRFMVFLLRFVPRSWARRITSKIIGLH
jgi:short-subunit dehydrogenase